MIHARQPLFVLQSDGSVQNRYTVKVLNKMTEDLLVTLRAEGPDGLQLVGADKQVDATRGKVTARTVFVRVPRANLTAETHPITFFAQGKDSTGAPYSSTRESIFIGPKY